MTDVVKLTPESLSSTRNSKAGHSGVSYSTSISPKANKVLRLGGSEHEDEGWQWACEEAFS